jgi:hypothetical protein
MGSMTDLFIRNYVMFNKKNHRPAQSDVADFEQEEAAACSFGIG